MKKTLRAIVILLALVCLLTAVTSCEYLFKQPEETKYTVTFANEDGTVLQTSEVVSGKLPEYLGETPAKADDAGHQYTFKGWDAELAPVTADVTYTATYTSVVREYTVIFKNGDEVLEEVKVPYGTVPSYAGTPTKEPTEGSTYIFAGWDKELTAVTGDVTYNAVFTDVTNKYMITFVNHDGTELQKSRFEYGTVPTYTGLPAEKEGDAQYSYTFAGWDKELAAVTGETIYTATFTRTVKTYTVKFVNHDGSVLQESQVEYGTVPSYIGETATKAGDAQYSYTFAGWDAAPVAVTGEATYTATFSSSVNSYTVKFVNHDGTVLQESKVEYGTLPAYTGETAAKAGDAQYSYTFAGWDNEPAAVTGDVTYTATFTETVNKYTVKFVNWDGSSVAGIPDQLIEYGSKVSIPAAELNPTRPNSAGKGYTFDKWSPELTEETVVTGNMTFTATYTETELNYEYNFYDDDGITVIKRGTSSASVAVTAPQDPEKASTAQYSYTFDGWYTAKEGGEKVTEFGTLSENTSYYARYTAAVRQYTVRFVDEFGATLRQVTVDYGTLITAPADPTKDEDSYATYTFAGWSANGEKLEEGATVTGDVTYQPSFTENVKNYKVTFVNGGAIHLEKNDYHYGDYIIAPETDPTKEADVHNIYTFEGWYTAAEGGNKVTDFGFVYADTVYYARYTATTRLYTVKFVDNDGNLIGEELSLPYGATVTAPAVPDKDVGSSTFRFDGWDQQVIEVMGDTTYTATYIELKWQEIDYNPITDTHRYTAGAEEATAEETAAYGYTKKYLYIPLEWTDSASILNLVEGAEKIKFYLDATVPFADFSITMFVKSTGLWQVLDPAHPIVLELNPETGKYKIFCGNDRYNNNGNAPEIDSLSDITFNVNGNGNTVNGFYISNIMYFGADVTLNVPTEYVLDSSKIITPGRNHTVVAAPATEEEAALGITTTYTVTQTAWEQFKLFFSNIEADEIRFFYKAISNSYIGYTDETGNVWEKYTGAGLASNGVWIEYVLVRNSSGTYDVFTPVNGQLKPVQKIDSAQTYPNVTGTSGITNIVINGSAGSSFMISEVRAISKKVISVETVQGSDVLPVQGTVAENEVTNIDLSADTEAQALGIKGAVAYEEAGWSSTSSFADISAADVNGIVFFVKHTKGSTVNINYKGAGSYALASGGISGRWIQIKLISDGTSFKLYIDGSSSEWISNISAPITNLNELGIQNHDTAGGRIEISEMIVVKRVFAVEAEPEAGVENRPAAEVLPLQGTVAETEITAVDFSGDSEAAALGITDVVAYTEGGWSNTSSFADISAADVKSIVFYVKHTKSSTFNINFNGVGLYQLHPADISNRWIEVKLVSNGEAFDLYIDGALRATSAPVTNLNLLGLQNHDTTGGSVQISNMTITK